MKGTGGVMLKVEYGGVMKEWMVGSVCPRYLKE
jgi:hypothetical protein